MNLEFLKDLVSLNPIKTTYISNNLRANFNFIITDHVKDKEMNPDNVTLLEKLQKVLTLFLNNELDKELLYNLFGNKLDLTSKQFNYLYEKIVEDAYVNNLIQKFCYIMSKEHYAESNKVKLLSAVMDEEDAFTNLASFLIRECNGATKIK
ncbi:Maph98 [Matsumuraeses phaseoli granulovirus]|uniref:Maph98 n=1 Tax=Matsumuraeses phaseoli granulovirus TaxID=2760664 RepID=A0AAE7SYC0_9BBAC|nr:Maph98 [Matsumuraeses phaseoli granulovirus]QOD40061.1 Maph98 [Matsumuraeses phaseoli granulovirus]